jgi:hypothetical protein
MKRKTIVGLIAITAVVSAILFISVVGTASIFDTGAGTYPSIAGTHTGTIESNQTVTVQKIYTYPCEGTGGHSEHVIIRNKSEKIAEAYWDGYQEDWHNITFSDPFTLIAGETYYYTIRTGSYPLIHHTHTIQTANGWINCTEFVDVNGKSYDNWIPAISLQEQNATSSLTPKFLSNSSYITFYVVGEIENTLPSNIDYVKIIGTFFDAQKKEIGSDYTYADMHILKPNQKAPFQLFAFFPEKIYPDSYTLKISYRDTNEEPYTGLKIISHNARINPILEWHEIVGEVKNEGTKRVTDVEVVCTYYDAEGKVIATETDYLFDVSLSAGDTAPFKLWLFPSELRPSSYKLQVQGMVVEDATPTPTPTPTATPTPAGIITMVKKDSLFFCDDPIDIGFSYPGSGSNDIFLLLDLSIENCGYESFKVYLSNFFITIDNVKYNYDSYTFSISDHLKSVELLDGGKTTGKIIFMVPKTGVEYEWGYDTWQDYNIKYE